MQVAANFAKKKVLGDVSERLHKNRPAFETDPEILAATQEIAAKKKHHWYNRKVVATPDLILNKHEREVLIKVKNRAWYLDKGFHCCCFHVGLDGIIGLIPGIGDVITTVMAMQLVRTASKANLPKAIIAKMMWNVMFDFMIGLTPIAGDILDIFFKCNWRNAMILEEFLIMRRMDEIRLEKGLQVTLNNDHSATTSMGALGWSESSTTHTNAVSPLPAIYTPSKPTNNNMTDTVSSDSTKKKYEPFYALPFYMSLDKQPDPIVFKDHIFDFSFHPLNNIVAVGLINGQVQCHNYSVETSNNVHWSTQVSKKSCRGVEFTRDGAHLLSISRDKSIQALDVASGRMLYKIPKAHKYAINKICKLDTHLIATGDDEGIVKIWDMRTCKSIQDYKVHDDFVADMSYCEHKSCLLVAGGDGVLSVYDTRNSIDKISITDEIDDELLSMTVIQNGKKVIAGSSSGALYTWDWNQWDSSRKWLGHPSSIDSICKLDEEVICTGGSDGLLRLISVQPYQCEGVLGDHGEDFPIECVKMDHHQQYLASCGHDLQLRFWNVQFLFDETTTLKRSFEQEDDEPVSKRMTRETFFENL